MNLEKMSEDVARSVKTQEDLGNIMGQLAKKVLEAALNGEMQSHLGYQKHQKASERKKNTRNGTSSKTLKTELGELNLAIPRDRNANFEPCLIPKGKTRLEGIEKTILNLYTMGITTRDIQESIKDLYHGANISHEVISNVTDAVIDEVKAWQNRPLNAVYPILYMDGIVVKARQDRQVINKTIYLVLGITTERHKELLGIWISEREEAKFWLRVLTDLQNRGVREIFIACVDGLKGFPEAIESAFPKAKVQLCIVHIVRNSLRYVSNKDKRKVVQNLKCIYNAETLSKGEDTLDESGK